MPSEFETAITEQTEYGTIITTQGAAIIADCILNGKKLPIVEAAAGDGGDEATIPTPGQTALVNERWRGEIAGKSLNPTTPNMIDVKVVIEDSVGGFTIREMGLYSDTGVLIAVCNTPATEKVSISGGVSGKLTMLMHIVVADASVLDFIINPSLDTVNRQELEAALEAHNTDPEAHPGLTTRMLATELALNGSATILAPEGDPTTETVGKKGQHYINMDTGTEWECAGVKDGDYIWGLVDYDSDKYKSMRDILSEAATTAALSNKAALSAQKAVELASPVKRTVRLEASGLQNYLDRLPRLLTEYLTLEVSGELSSAVEIRDFYGPGNLTVVSSSGGFTSRGIRVTHCSVFVYLKNIAFQEREDMTPNDALLDVQHCGHFVQVVYCGFTGLGGAERCIGVQAAYGSRVEMGNCLASGLGVVVQAARGSIITADGDSSSYEDNAVGAYVWHGGIVLLTSPVPDTLGAPANKKYGGLIAKTDGTLL